MALAYRLGATLVIATSLVTSACAQQQNESAADSARNVLAITDLVLERHIDPPTRQQMILAGAKALARKSGQRVPADLSRRISDLAGHEPLAELLEQLWSTARQAGTTPETVRDSTLEGILSAIPGRPELISS